MNKLKEITNRKISIKDTLSSALKQMDRIGKKLLLVFDGEKFKSLLSIGDIQRAIINVIPLDSEVGMALRNEIGAGSINDSIESLKERMIKGRAELMPIVDNKGNLIDVLFWEEFFPKYSIPKEKFELPVVIMAGGKGTRLKPLTNVIPKPLIPIGEKTILEEIMDRFVDVGCDNFFLSVNHKAETIKHYFLQLEYSKYKINYFQEEKPLGTAGSLYLIKDKIKTTFFISNCDIIINEDYSEIIKYHREKKNELTIVSALKHLSIPYGTIETKKDGVLSELKEKPELTFQINSGMYILEPHLLNEMPENEFFHITHLIDYIKNRGGRVGVFPVSEKSWIDIGDWYEYFKAINKDDLRKNLL